jgi:hypothetical protein
MTFWRIAYLIIYWGTTLIFVYGGDHTPHDTIITMTPSPYSDADREIIDTIRLHLFTCYTNAEDGRAFTREELEETFASDADLRTWVAAVAGINLDTLADETNLGRAMMSVCMDAWVAKVTEWSDEDTFRCILAGLQKILQ